MTELCWRNADTEPPELTYPTCQDCNRDPFVEVPDIVYQYATVCRHETNVHWCINGGPMLVRTTRRDAPEIYNRVVDYRAVMSGSGAVSWRRSWASGRGSLDMLGTFWMPVSELPPLPTTEESSNG